MRIVLVLLLFFMIACGSGDDSRPVDIYQVTNDHFEYSGLMLDLEVERGGYVHVFMGKIKNDSGINIQTAWFEITLFDLEKEVIFNSFRFWVDDFIAGTTRSFKEPLDLNDGDPTEIQFGLEYVPVYVDD